MTISDIINVIEEVIVNRYNSKSKNYCITLTKNCLLQIGLYLKQNRENMTSEIFFL